MNGFTYRTDDHSNDPASNPTVISVTNQTFSTSGIITTPTDKDAFKFVFATRGALHLNAVPYAVNASTLDGADLDIKVTLQNASFQTIGTYDPATLLNAVIDTTLNAGTYYITLQGTGNAYATSYNSLGSYTISGTFSPNGVTPIRDVALTGKVNNGVHNLNWNIIADEAIKTIVVQSSFDGRFFTDLATVDPKQSGFGYTPTINGDILYRLKVTSVIDQTAYSNIISLKAGTEPEKFKVSTLVHDEIVIRAYENYQYQLVDIQGRVIGNGNGTTGTNRINVSNAPNGMYIIQMIMNSQRQTERIIKQ